MIVILSYIYNVSKKFYFFINGLLSGKDTGASIIDGYAGLLIYFPLPPLVADPVTSFSLYIASDLTKLIGPINGTLQRGAFVIPGVKGTAFYTDAGAG